MGMTSYWCQLFILPRDIIKKVNIICRAYSQQGDINNSFKGNVDWNLVCRPKKCGGLGVRNLDAWNPVVVGKLSWHISSMQESLWVRWIHGVYTKGTNWMIFNPPITASWSLKKICAMRDKLSTWMLQEKYVINEIYHLYVVPNPRVKQDKFVWNRLSISIARFILWLIMCRKLKTRD